MKRRLIAPSLLLSFLFSTPLFATPNDITRASRTSGGSQATGGASSSPSVSSDGNYVVFASDATNLVTGDSNATTDIFLRDRGTPSTTRISVRPSTGADGDAASGAPYISKNGSYIVFHSTASNLVGTDSAGKSDIFLYQRSGGTLSRVSVNSSGGSPNGDSYFGSISDDGVWVVYQSSATNIDSSITDSNGVSDIFLYNTSTTDTILISHNVSSSVAADGPSTTPIISSDGNYVAFVSTATNLVTGDPAPGGYSNIYLYNRGSGAITRISKDTGSGAANGSSTAPSISSDGQLIAFASTATDLVASDTNGYSDIFLYDSAGPSISRISVTHSSAQSNGHSYAPSISADGTYVAYLSDATNILSSDTNNTAADFQYDIYEYKVSDGSITRENVTLAGTQKTGTSSGVALNGDGSVVAFDSTATKLINGDTNGYADIFVTDTSCPTDSDADTVVDCSDSCPLDSTKNSSAGTCGCGVAETDTDSDSVKDCEDACPDDANKSSSPGVCGCGESDDDTNNDGSADCNDFTSSTKPLPPELSNSSPGVLIVKVPSVVTGARYIIELRKGQRTIATRTISTSTTTFRKLKLGNYSVRYRTQKSSIKSLFSAKTTTRVRT